MQSNALAIHTGSRRAIDKLLFGPVPVLRANGSCPIGIKDIMGELITFLKSLHGVIVSATGVITATVALLAALRKLGPIVTPLRKWFTKTHPTPPLATPPTKQPPNPLLVGLAVAAVSITGTALLYGVIVHENPLALSGSTNVYAYLRDNFPAAFDRSISLTDVGSSQAQRQAFEMFDYGQSTAQIRETGWLALSSNGDDVLRATIGENKDNQAFLDSNYWLSEIVARRPLMILYRKIPSEYLKTERTNVFPPELRNGTPLAAPDYSFVRVAQLKQFLQAAASHQIKLFLPEADTGTRAIFDANQREPFAWPKAGALPTYIEKFNGDFPMLSIVSEVPVSAHPRQNSTECDLLKEQKLQVALICGDHDVCDGFPSARFTVIGKVGQGIGFIGSRFKLLNPGECRFMRSLDPNIDDTCGVAGNPDDLHVIEVESSAAMTVPPIVGCGS